MQFAHVLDSLLQEKGITAYRLSKEIGFSQSLLSDWRKGKNVPSSDKLLILSEYFGVSVDYLLGKRSPLPVPTELPEGVSLVPIVDKIQAVHPILCQECIKGYAVAAVKDAENCFYLRMPDDSMQCAGIMKGSLVLIRKQNSAKNGQIVACILSGETATLKRFKQQGNVVLLLPENSAYDTLVLSTQDFENNQAILCGVAVSVTTEL